MPRRRRRRSGAGRRRPCPAAAAARPASPPPRPHSRARSPRRAAHPPPLPLLPSSSSSSSPSLVAASKKTEQAQRAQRRTLHNRVLNYGSASQRTNPAIPQQRQKIKKKKNVFFFPQRVTRSESQILVATGRFGRRITVGRRDRGDPASSCAAAGGAPPPGTDGCRLLRLRRSGRVANEARTSQTATGGKARWWWWPGTRCAAQGAVGAEEAGELVGKDGDGVKRKAKPPAPGEVR
uniref:Uncharacterized protein n=1 Tax=Oryza brachyantha TaxID=4533 RepID=J3L4Z0_ORYBR